MIKNFLTKIDKKLSNSNKTMPMIVAMLIFSYLSRPIPVHATYLAPLTNLKVLLLSILALLGVIVAAFGLYRLADSLQHMDQGGERQGYLGIAAGAIMVGGSVILGVLGF